MGDEQGSVASTVGTERAKNMETRRSLLSNVVIANVRARESSIESAERTREAQCNGCGEISKKVMSCVNQQIQGSDTK